MDWRYTKPVKPERIQEVETELNVRFPNSFVECVKKNNAGRPNAILFDLGNDKEKVFGNLFDFNDSEYGLSILEAYESLVDEHEAPKELIPFADDPAGNFICFDYRSINNGEPAVVFFYHERDEDNIRRISNSFEDFINKLYEPK
ncbi:SMI1/KNR4 family protein [Paludifilum halophilum]|nr:SMI1/KNR4 family protein [Paludifilum halophilum]